MIDLDIPGLRVGRVRRRGGRGLDIYGLGGDILDEI
jgi:hypothetical protein